MLVQIAQESMRKPGKHEDLFLEDVPGMQEPGTSKTDQCPQGTFVLPCICHPSFPPSNLKIWFLSSSASADCLYTNLIHVLASASQACFRFAGGQPSLKGHPLRIAELNLLECYRRRHRTPSNSRNDSTRILPICPCEVVQAPDV